MDTGDRRTLSRFVGWYFLTNGFIFWLLGYGYLKNILLSQALFKNYIADFSSIGGKFLILAFAFFNYLSFMLLLAFIPAVLVGIFVLLIPNKRLIFFIAILAASLNLLILFIDTQVFSMFKFHLNGVLLGLLTNGQFFDLFDFSSYELLIFAVFLCFVVLIEIWVAHFIWNKMINSRRFHWGKTIGSLWLGTFLLCYFTLTLSIARHINLFSQQTPNLPFYNLIMSFLIPDKNAAQVLTLYSEQHYARPYFSSSKIQYPLHSMHCEKPAKPLNIILILVDTLRSDSLNHAHMPNTSLFAKQSWQFQNNLSGGNSTQPGITALFYSIPSSYWTAISEQKKSPVLTQLLQQNQYQIKVLLSGGIYNPPYAKTVYFGVPNLNKNLHLGMDVGENDRQITKEAIAFLQSKPTNPFYLHLFYDAVHGYCRSQSYPTPYQPAIKYCSRIGLSNKTDAQPFINRYLNAVHFVDGELGLLFDAIKQQGYWDNSVIIVTADHGQEFNDNKQNYWEHASNFTDAQMHIPLLVHWPQKDSKIITYQTSNYDIIPTMLQRLFHCANPTEDYSIGQDLLKEQGRLSFILAGSYSNMGIIEPDRLTTLLTSGPITITDKHAKPLSDAQPRVDTIKQALQLMRRYFQ